MKPTIFFRIAALLITLFAAGHTLGFRQTDPAWGLDSMLSSMKTIRFSTQGFQRTYWDFFVGFGLFVTVFLLFAAFVAWQLGGLSRPALASLRPLAWALTISFGLVTILSWRFFFIAPVIFSFVIFACLLAGSLTIDHAL